MNAALSESLARTNNLHVVDAEPLIAPQVIHAELPLSAGASQTVAETRHTISNILNGEDKRLFAVVGPCSIHDVDAAKEYAHKLLALREELHEHIVILMRVYFEKPRTTTGWKGLINDPHLDGSYDIAHGLRTARKLLLELAELGLPSATEVLDPVSPQYVADLVSWAAIGARTTESQTHREMASGLSMPVGFKNSTDGSLSAAVNAMISASQPHRFLGMDSLGHVSTITTTGNKDTHVVLRGSDTGPNCNADGIAAARAALEKSGHAARIVVDCSHGNSYKDHTKQPAVLDDLGEQIAAGDNAICGVMIESHLLAGKQKFPCPKDQLVYGQSITDACVDFTTTETMLRKLAAVLAQR